ncbi:MAG: prepilin peptidase [Candidatus Gastranaerophilales bacterium]|nr:prepilin peptidase [Candidatus Gastranaerophilales bacterium]
MSDIILICFFVLAIGACIGSFLNVVALRALTGESIVFPASKCPYCSKHIKWFDNIPVFSYFFTFKGKCRNCGAKVSKQYPIVESLTSILFLAVFIYYGISLQTLFIWILLSMGIVISITDIKEQAIFDIHAYIFIVFAIIYSLFVHGIKDYMFVILGVAAGIAIMEIIARGAYLIILRKNKSENAVETNNDEINSYIDKNKRVFGIGDTYITAGAGALLGWKSLLISIILAIVIQFLFILPEFVKQQLKVKNYKFLISLIVFFAYTALYYFCSTAYNINIIVLYIMLLLFYVMGAYIVIQARKTGFKHGFCALPFGPALIAACFIILFFGNNIMELLNLNF